MTSQKNSKGDKLAKLFDEIHKRWEQKESFSPISDETAGDLSLPMDSLTSLCYFVVTRDYLPFYTSNIFPLFVQYGLEPITPMGFAKGGENILAKIPSIIQRSFMVVIDASSFKQQYQYELTLALEKKKKILLITDERTKLPFDIKNMEMTIFERPQNVYSEDIIGFLNRLEEFLSTNLLDVDLLSKEPERLLKKHEYGAAVISAFSILESILRKRVEDDPKRRYEPFMKLLYETTSLLTKTELAELRYWYMYRNEIVHRSAKISQSQAKKIVELITSVINKLLRSST